MVYGLYLNKAINEKEKDKKESRENKLKMGKNPIMDKRSPA